MRSFRRRTLVGEHLPETDRAVEQARVAGGADHHPILTHIDGVLFGARRSSPPKHDERWRTGLCEGETGPAGLGDS